MYSNNESFHSSFIFEFLDFNKDIDFFIEYNYNYSSLTEI